MHTIHLFLRSESDDTNAANDSNISGNSSGTFSSSSSTQDEDDESSNSSPECADISLSNNDASLIDMSSTTTPDVPGIDYIQRAKDLISDDGFAAIVDSAKTFEDEINLINATSHQPELR